ncbi:MAG TPA: transglutaminase domain-containing protein [Mycobacteriales bacterium]|nr:transglutaminase domain-containing protein [Mycobacteriales bacterium]
MSGAPINDLRPRLVLTSWPEVSCGRFLDLMRPPAAEESELRRRLPDVAETAWATALGLTRWSSQQWSHDGVNDAEDRNAVELLDRAAAGERFRCVEYATVLAQSLNVTGIPARGVHALRDGYDRPVTGMGHVVVEAWIEDLDRWVVLDPQNEGYWCAGDQPLGAVELWRRYRAGESRPEFRLVDGTLGDADEADHWWLHWADVGVGRSALVDERGYAAIFQGRFVLGGRRRLLADPAQCYPKLSSVEISVTESGDGALGLNICANHPYAAGIRVDGGCYATANAFHSLNLEPGEHTLTIAAATRWNRSAPNEVTYQVLDQTG